MTIRENGPGAVTLGTADRALAIAEVKAVLRVTTGDEDALIAAFAETALGLAEGFAGQVWIARTMTDLIAADGPAAGGWRRIAALPVRSIAAVAACDAAGVATPLGIDRYAIDVDPDGTGWVRVIDGGGAERFAVTIVAGVATGWAAVPAPIRQGAALLAAHLFTLRDTADAPPAAVTALWRPFRVLTLGSARPC